MRIPPRQEMAEVPRPGLAGSLKADSTAITRVSLRNFKGHESLDLDMGRITVLIGPTGSGKSTVLQALGMLHSALRSDGGIMRGNGIHGHGQFVDIVANRDEAQQVAIGVGGQKRVRTEGGYDVDTEFSCRMTFGVPPHPPEMDAVVDIRCGSVPPHAGTMRLEHSGGAGRTVATGAGSRDGTPTPVRAVGGLIPRMHANLAGCPAAEAFRSMFGNGEYFRLLLDDLWHVPFSRVVTHDKLPLEYNASIMSRDRSRAAASLLSHVSGDNLIQKKISGMVKEVGHKRIATRTIPVGKGERGMLALDFVGERSYNAITHEGSGLNQLATMFAILAYSPSGSVVTIEEPEIHLDPAAQARLMGIMVRQAIEEGKQIVFTTHSDHLLYPLLAHVKKKACPLACGDVAMHYFDTDESGAVAGVERLDINEHGQISGGLRGFWDADMKAMGEVLG